MNESSITDNGFTSISLKERTPLSVFSDVFDEEVLLIKQTFMEKQSHHLKKNSNWKNVSKKENESFVGLVILMGTNNLPSMKLYSSEEMVFQNPLISSLMSRNRFRRIFYNLHLPDNSLKPKRGSREYNKIYTVKNFTEIVRRNFQKIMALPALGQ